MQLRDRLIQVTELMIPLTGRWAEAAAILHKSDLSPPLLANHKGSAEIEALLTELGVPIAKMRKTPRR